MRKLILSAFVIAFLAVPATCFAATGSSPCKKHSDCSDLEVCNSRKCESAIGRTYVVTVVSAKISEKRTTAPAKGKAWDVFGGLPDPRVTVYFPDVNTKAFTVKGLKDTTTPKWNKSREIVVSAAGQEIWFCLADQDASDHDSLKTNTAGSSSCVGSRNILDFIRKGSLKVKTSADVKSFRAKIKRK
jgi:hypothetical protein